MKHISDWKRSLQSILNEHLYKHARKPKNVSNQTQDLRGNFYFCFFAELRNNEEHPFKVDPSNLSGRHVQFMVERWVKRGLAPGTIQVYLSYLRVFCEWIGKPGMVLPPEYYVDDPALVARSYSAQQDKSWSAKGIDVGELIVAISDCDRYVAMQLELAWQFGTRVKEAVMCRPRLADVGERLFLVECGVLHAYLELKAGTKGGRVRYVPIDTQEKRATLDKAKRLARQPNAHLGDPERTLKQSIRRFYYVMERFGVSFEELGVTPHGVRNQYANDRYEKFSGAPSPVRGGEPVDAERDRAARLSVAEELGHGRASISSAYLGGLINIDKSKP